MSAAMRNQSKGRRIPAVFGKGRGIGLAIRPRGTSCATLADANREAVLPERQPLLVNKSACATATAARLTGATATATADEQDLDLAAGEDEGVVVRERMDDVIAVRDDHAARADDFGS